MSPVPKREPQDDPLGSHLPRPIRPVWHHAGDEDDQTGDDPLGHNRRDEAAERLGDDRDVVKNTALTMRSPGSLVGNSGDVVRRQ
jgi:hypothetical protein